MEPINGIHYSRKEKLLQPSSEENKWDDGISYRALHFKSSSGAAAAIYSHLRGTFETSRGCRRARIVRKDEQILSLD